MFKNKEEQFDFYWKEIFDGLAYNPIEFNTYRFDQSMSLPGKVNKLYELFKVLAMNNQEVMDYLKAFVETFDEKLYETIEDVLTVWLEDGRLADVVRVAISEEVIEARTDYLDKKYVNLKERLDVERKEVIEARGGVSTLGERLNDTDLQIINAKSRINDNAISPDDFPGTDFERVQSAINKAILDKTSIRLSRIYDVTNPTPLLINKDDDRFNLTFIGVGGGFNKNNRGFMFDTSKAFVGDITFSLVKFRSETGVGTTIINGEKIIRVKTFGCHFQNVDRYVYSSNYLQTIYSIGDSIIGGLGSFIEAPAMYDISYIGHLVEHRENFFTKLKPIVENPIHVRLYNVRFIGGVIEGLSGYAFMLGHSDAVLINSNYFEKNKKGHIRFNNETETQGVTISNNSCDESPSTYEGSAFIEWGNRGGNSTGNAVKNIPMHDATNVRKTSRVISRGDETVGGAYRDNIDPKNVIFGDFNYSTSSVINGVSVSKMGANMFRMYKEEQTELLSNSRKIMILSFPYEVFNDDVISVQLSSAHDDDVSVDRYFRSNSGDKRQLVIVLKNNMPKILNVVIKVTVLKMVVSTADNSLLP